MADTPSDEATGKRIRETNGLALCLAVASKKDGAIKEACDLLETAIIDACRFARLEGRREMRLTPGDSPQKTAAWQAFIKSMGAEMPQNADGTYDGAWFVSVMEAIKAYLTALDPELPETPT